MGIQIGFCQECNQYAGVISIPCWDYKDENKIKIIDRSIKVKQDSIILPNGNNLNSYYESKLNQNNNNEEDGFNLSLSPISKGKKNNINFYQNNMNNNESSNNKYNSSNIETNKIYEPLKIKIENKAIIAESYVKEESNSKEEENYEQEEENNEQKEENSEQKEENNDQEDNSDSNYSNSNSKENNNEELIKAFDDKIKEFAEYISEEKFRGIENPKIKEIENNLKELNCKKKFKNYFERPPLLFKKDKSIYKGSWNNKGEKSGFGIFLDSQGNKYIGQWENDKFNGKGRLLSLNGDYYEGDFNMGLIEGNGSFYLKKDEYKYIGTFKENKFHGEGQIKYEKEDIIYEGEFNEGYKHGFGKIFFKDKSYYEGNFENNNFNGKGKFIFENNKSYNGDWKNNTMDGKGTFAWGNNTKYKGDYKNNMREGNGVYSFGCNLYDGGWVRGMPHGEGTLLYEGLRIFGKFRYGKILELVEGKAANKELTERYTIDSKNNIKFDDTFNDTINKDISVKDYKRKESLFDINKSSNKKIIESKSSIKRNVNKTFSKTGKSGINKKFNENKIKNKNNKDKENEKEKEKETNKNKKNKKKSKDKDKNRK